MATNTRICGQLILLTLRYILFEIFCKGLHFIISVPIYKVYTVQQPLCYALEPSTVNLYIQVNKSKAVGTLLTCCSSRTKFKVLGRDSRSLCVVSLRGEFRIRGMIGGWGGGGLSQEERSDNTSWNYKVWERAFGNKCPD